ncbi:MAG: hypothetical protein QM535_10950 [Limnohabitans sp.]|nr:hypothetical protein [Limnohabitans sp.]
MKPNYLYILIIVCYFSSYSQKNTQLKQFERYDKIRLLSYNMQRYAYKPENELKIIGNKINFKKDLKFIDDIILSEKQKNKILSILIEDHSKKNCRGSDCYMPRHIILFYKKYKLIDFYEFCAECGGDRKSKGLDILSHFCDDKGQKIKELLKKMKLKNYGDDDTGNYKYY